jgi:hypothetical protein
MKKIFLLLLLLLCNNAFAALTDVKFGRYQIADSQWNVNACLNTTTCQIYSKQPGIAYKIPWTSGQVQWAAGDYVKFDLSGNQSFPYTAKQYDSNGNLKATLGNGKIVNMGPDYFFFVGSDNNTGQLFSGSSGMSNTSGVSWTGTLNPTIAQADTYANATYSTEPLAAGQTAAPAAPSLCCGGSSNSFNASATNVAKVQAFVNRTTNDSQVYIEQLGNQNTITVNQTGTRNNYTKYYGNGSSNTINIAQSGNNNTQANYIDASVIGNTNNINLQQQSTGGSKGIFATVNNNSNNLLVQQKDNGNHYVDVSLIGGNKNVDILQQGSASHMAKVTLSGNPTDLSLNQSGSTQNFYSINFNCATAGGCAKITVQQGQ